MPRFRLIRLLAGLVVTLGAFGLAPMSAQSPRPMGIVDLLSLPRLADVQLSPDGRQVLFTRSDADWKSGRRVTHIWRARTTGDAETSIQLTNDAESENAPRWSPDGKTIAFTAKRGDDEFDQAYQLSIEGGEARQLTTHATAVTDISWTPDGSALYFRAAEAKTADEIAREKLKDDVYGYDENYKQVHLWTVGVENKSETRVTAGDFSITSYELSADGKKLAFHRTPTPLLGSGAESDVWIANADGSGARKRAGR